VAVDVDESQYCVEVQVWYRVEESPSVLQW
jgi:hypothetical protein